MHNDLHYLLSEADKNVRKMCYREAVDYLRHALTFSMPDHVLKSVYDQLGICLKHIGDYKAAEYYFNELTKMGEYEHLQEVYLNLVSLYEETSDLRKAVGAYKKLSDMFYDDPEAHMNNYCFNLWAKQNTVSPETLEEQRKHVFEYMPKISIVTPVYNTKLEHLTQMLDSVLAQSYLNVELCLADGNSDDARIRGIIKDYAEKSDKIKYVFLEDNQGISGNTNEAISITEGEYIAFLDHDDILSPDTVYEFVKAINENRNAKLFYSDSVVFSDTSNENCYMMFKPEWSPHNIVWDNYIVHLVVVKKSVFDKTGMFDSRFDGLQDTVLIWKISEYTKEMVHIPKVLYWWRYFPTSASYTINYYENLLVGRSEHFNRIGLKNRIVFDGKHNTLSFDNLSRRTVSVIIPSQDNAAGLKRCINHLLGGGLSEYIEIIIVDNHSSDPTVLKYYESLRSNGKVKIVRPKSVERKKNIPLLLNAGAKASNSEFLLFLNRESVIVTKSWFVDLLILHDYYKTGAMGMAVKYKHRPGENIVEGGFEYIGSNADLNGFYDRKIRLAPLGHTSFEKMRVTNVSALSHAGLMVSKKAYSEVEGFDELFPLTFYIMDFCAKLMDRGYYNVLDPSVRVIYNERDSLYYAEAVDSLKAEITPFTVRWEKKLGRCDPFFNPNLSQENYDLYGCKYKVNF